MRNIVAGIAAALIVSATSWAMQSDKYGNPEIDTDEPIQFVTKKSGRFDGNSVSYRTVAGDTFLRGSDGEPEAAYFSMAYIKEGVTDPTTRPVTFIFNGGPSSASMWLHMGVFGPKRVVIPSDPDDDGAPPYDVVNNPETILDVSDLVFIDPIGTGLSRSIDDNDPRKHWGVLEDAESVAKFVRQWIVDNNRWNSPKFIAGESYGTVRASIMADELTNKHNIGLNGIMLISAVLDYQNSRIQDGSIMGYVSFLPSFAATAWYHNKLPNKPENLETFLDEVRTFARTEYATALIEGTRMDDARQAAIIDKLHNYTGLKKSYLKAANMRVHVFRFFKELMRDEGKVVGRLDSRYLGEEPDAAGEFFMGDPFSYASGNAFNVAINDHLRNFMDVEIENREYNMSARAAKRFKWNWNVWGKDLPNGGRFINVIPYLGKTMRRNKDMRVLVTQGYYDFATPFFGAENALAEVDIVKERVEFTYYEAGHMMYVHEPSRLQFLKDIRTFIQENDKQ
ncbi:S10 family peptidase [Kordiimonas aquimaris]|uniref:S10 family peptidase n=1 Tax=Kordiimonas aquimaris TaxID=707591 RepID=UPI0021CFDA75|nr:peptidase S10 [Kordiimonas aquimaris]